MSALRPAEIAGLLDERFRLLTRRRADAANRQQTLQAAIEWSYALLGQGERQVFDGLGVYPASFDAAAAVEVSSIGGLQRWDVLDGLTALVGKSMVAEDEGPDQASRYRLLETMRAYAQQQLAAVGKLGELQRAHAEHYAAFAERAGPELLGPAQLEWQGRIQAERDNLQTAIAWALASSQRRPHAFRIVAALVAIAASSPAIIRGWAEACVAQISACPPQLRAPVLGAAAWSAFFTGDLSLAQQRAEDSLEGPASGDPVSLGITRAALAQIYALAGQPERGASIAREGRQEAAAQGSEVLVGHFLAMEALAWARAGHRDAARWPAMEAVKTAQKVQNPMLSAMAFYGAAHAIWPSEPQAALTLIEDSVALTHAGACDTVFDFALSLASSIRARNGDLPGALAALQEAMVRQHADGNRLLLGITLQSAATMLAPLGQARPAGAGRSRICALPWVYLGRSPRGEDGDHQAQSLARDALGESTYSAALEQGTLMNGNQVVGYAFGELRQAAVVLAELGGQAPETLPRPGDWTADNDRRSAIRRALIGCVGAEVCPERKEDLM